MAWSGSSPTIISIPYLILLVPVLYLLSRLLLNFLRLRNIPGPFLASITDLWRARHQWRGSLRANLIRLHEEKGPLVRYGVNSVSINDPSAISIIYGSRAGFVTADSYKVIVGISNGKEVPSLVSMADEAKHGAMRRSIASAFTPAGVLDYEVHVDETLPELVDAMVARREIVVNLSEWMMYYSMDSAARMSFGETLGCMQKGTDAGGSIELIRDRFNHWGAWSSLPGLERLIYRNRISIKSARTPSSMVAAAVGKLRARVSAPEKDTARTQKDLLQKFIAASEANPETLDTQGIVGLLMSTISGAGDTTATTLAATFHYLLKHPTELERLKSELTNAGMLEGRIPGFSQISKLPFLNAVIKESMRLMSTPTWPMERKVPAGGVTLVGVYIPEGTSVGVMPAAVHLNEDVFGRDVKLFRPGRWVDLKDEKRLQMMESAHLGFSRGRRVCLGQNVAIMQMKKVISLMVMSFKVSHCHFLA